MSIILIGGEKGGTGKTTLSANLAAQRANAGHDVLLVDTDIQGSASYWAATREENGTSPRVNSIQKFGKALASELQDLAKRYEDIIVDAGGRDSVELRAALVVADRVYAPIQASQFDVWTLDRMDSLVAQAQSLNQDLNAWVVINRASPNPSVGEAKEAQNILAEFEHLNLARTIICDRIAYRKAARDGLSVSEVHPQDTKAAAEIDFFYREVYGNDESPNTQTI
ncbi:Cobyrinic acid ac-diamide synthase (plasmid) [Nitrosococcus halophilus Nc 4]|uniref:Cobyrinic acid ac-diamide synthase n=1 Tax=Nitrosococcus halophilus (strain Nc4) TaxID=472759 RepID=D5C5F7_NITHN|nr:AAA family ATPase [Nitrosococcus halophilus]ADE17011.1 Cobyrinic acid ac-diamide synthase [Nitrosococcus halophilus Nc 4]